MMISPIQAALIVCVFATGVLIGCLVVFRQPILRERSSTWHQASLMEWTRIQARMKTERCGVARVGELTGILFVGERPEVATTENDQVQYLNQREEGSNVHHS